MSWIFFSTREPIRLDVLGHRARKGKVTDIASPKKKAYREEVLSLKLATARRIVIRLAVDQTRKPGVVPQRDLASIFFVTPPFSTSKS